MADNSIRVKPEVEGLCKVHEFCRRSIAAISRDYIRKYYTNKIKCFMYGNLLLKYKQRYK
jgi:hypothetical protein